MPVNPTYPGVYVEELPSGVRPIVGVSTSVTAFVGRFLRGPSNVPVTALSFGAFERDFGGLWRQSSASYAVQQFFLNGGTQAVIVRVGEDEPLNPFTAAEIQLEDDPDPAVATKVVRVRAGRRVRGESVLDPGSWGNLIRLEVDYDVANTDATEFFNLTVHELTVASGRLSIRTTESFRNLTLRPDDPQNAIEVVNAGSRLVQLDVDQTPVPPSFPVADYRPAPTGTLSDPLASGLPGNGDTIEVKLNTNSVGLPVPVAYDATVTDFVTYRSVLEAAIRTADPDDPRVSGATVQIVEIDGDLHYRVLAGRGGSNFDPDDVLTFAGPVAVALGLNGDGNLQMYSLGGTNDAAQVQSVEGGDGIAITEASLSGTPGAKTGVHALADADLFNLLSVPEAAEQAPADLATLYTKALAYCRQRRAFLLVDIPQSVRTVDAMQTWMTSNAGLRNDHSAVFFPRPRVPDPLEDNRLKSRVASGTLAGLFARIDGDRGVWKAPAGTEARLRNVPELDYLLTDDENGLLNPQGINCLRNMPIVGNINWGARTLDGADALGSQWKYIPVRRLALFIEESLYRGLQWTVFEPNDEPLWSQIRLNVGSFMHDLFRKGAFQGSTPRQAYLVQCDSETTPQSDIDKGIVNIIVGFAPLKPAEFVILKIKQLAGQTPA